MGLLLHESIRTHVLKIVEHRDPKNPATVGHLGPESPSDYGWLTRGAQQHRIPVKFEIFLLAFGKPAHIEACLCFDGHALERRSMGKAGDDQVPRVFKSDEASVKKVINVGRRQQPILPMQTLLIR